MLIYKCTNKGGEIMDNLNNRIAFRCTDEFKENVLDMCSEKGETLSNYLTFLILDDMDKYYSEKGGE